MIRSLTGARRDAWVAAVAVALLGCSTVLALRASATGSLGFGLVAALAGGLALTTLLAAGWVDALAFLVVMLPLPALYSTDTVRISAALLATVLVIFAWVVGSVAPKRRIRLGGLPRLASLALIVGVLVATLFAESPMPAARELVNWTLLILLLVAATDHLLARAGRVRSLAFAIAGVTGVAGAAAVLEAIGVLPGRFPLTGTSLNRATIGFGWPNESAMFLALGIPFTVFAFQSVRRPEARAIALAALAAAALGLAATFSRGSWLGLVAASSVLLLVRAGRMVPWIWAGIVVALVGADVALGGALRDRVLGTASDPYVAQRMALTLTGLLIFAAHPVVGVGPGGFEEALSEFGPQVTWLWDYVGSAHNAYVDVAAEMGLVGLLPLLWFVGATLRILFRGAKSAEEELDETKDEVRLRHALLWSFSTVVLVSFAAWPFAHGIGQLVVLVAAMGFALESRSRESQDAIPSSSPRTRP